MTALESWHERHDAYVAEYGDEARPEAVRLADTPTAIVAKRVIEQAAFFGTDTNFTQVMTGPFAPFHAGRQK